MLLLQISTASSERLVYKATRSFVACMAISTSSVVLHVDTILREIIMCAKDCTCMITRFYCFQFIISSIKDPFKGWQLFTLWQQDAQALHGHVNQRENEEREMGRSDDRNPRYELWHQGSSDLPHDFDVDYLILIRRIPTLTSASFSMRSIGMRRMSIAVKPIFASSREHP